MSENIHFIYNHCTPDDFKNDMSFAEDNFSQVLEECFQLNSGISHIEVFFDFNPGQSTEKFSCAVNVNVPKSQDIYVKNASENNYAQTVLNVCTKVVNLLRENKDKNTNFGGREVTELETDYIEE
ncbi:MAG: hypothetical protein OHK0017_07340 [Patescibacteria group bacterium]